MPLFKRCFFFLIDGSRPDLFEELFSEGDLPNIQRHVVEKGFYQRILTVFPSTTGPAYLPYLTGLHPGECNVPGIRWLDRHLFPWSPWTFKEYRSYVGPGSFFFDRDIEGGGGGARTLFELSQNPVSIFSLVHRGAGFWGNRTKVLGPLLALYGRATDHWKKVDRAIGEEILRSICVDDPDFLFAVFPSVDEYSHHYSPFDSRVRDALKGIDSILGRIVKSLKESGHLEETLFVLASDHGLTPTRFHLNLEHLAQFWSCGAPFSYPNIHRRWSKVAVMPSGNAMAHIYAKNGTWKKKISDEELTDRRNWTCRFLTEVVGQPAVAWVATQAEDGSVVIRGQNGEGRGRKKNQLWHYSVQGQDPLHYEGLAFPLAQQEVLARTFDTTYPNALENLSQLFFSRRCGDLIVTARPGYDLRSRFEFPEHRASHGSLHREQMQVPFACSASDPGRERTIRESKDVYAAICRWMGWCKQE